MTLRICILETDVLSPELREQFRGYGHMFEQLFAKQPLLAQFEVYNVVDGHYPTDSEPFDAYLVTGSKADSFGPEAWIQTLKEYLRQRYQSGHKLIGICFGHQLLALALGGHTERAQQGWGVGVHDYRVANQPQWMQPPLERLQLLISHQDQVTQLPEKATLLASSDFCPNAAYHIEDQVLCFQGHPEFIHDFSRALLDLRQQHLGDEIYKTGINSLHQEHQGTTVAKWMMQFVAQGKTAKA